jgi:hypothetical protein
MTTISGTFSGDGVSSVLRLRGAPEKVTLTIASGWSTGVIFLERSVTASETAWEPVLGPFSASTGFSGSYHAKPLERLRLRARNGFTGSSAYSFSDGDAVLFERRNTENEVVMRLMESGDRIYRDLWVDGTLHIGEVEFTGGAATESEAGVVELATAAETITGTDNTRATHPAGVAAALAAYVPAASETTAGKVELATNAETITGTDTVRATHPAGVAAAISAALASVASPPWTMDSTIRTGSWNATAGKVSQVNTSGGASSATIPASLSVGDILGFLDHAISFGTNNLTLSRNGHKINGLSSDYTADVSGVSVYFIYTGSTYGLVRI